MTATIGLVLDSADPDRLATFWSEALGYTTIGGAGNYVMLLAAHGTLPKLLLQAVPEGNVPESRVGRKPGQTVHLDLYAGGDERRGPEVDRLIELGAVRLWDCDENGLRWVTLADPEGNVFCVG